MRHQLELPKTQSPSHNSGGWIFHGRSTWRNYTEFKQVPVEEKWYKKGQEKALRGSPSSTCSS